MFRSSYGLSRYVASENDWTAAPVPCWTNAQLTRGVLFAGGHGSAASGAVGYTSLSNGLLNGLADYWPVMVGDWGGGTTWGNDTAITRLGQGKTYIQTQVAKSGKVHLFGASMGGLACLNYALANPANVASIFCLSPASDLNAIWSSDRGSLGWAAEINTAYGGTYSPATHGLTHSPNAYAAQLRSIPIQIMYTVDDTIVLPSETLAFAATHGNTTLVATTGAHATPVYPPDFVDRVNAWFTKYS